VYELRKTAYELHERKMTFDRKCITVLAQRRLQWFCGQHFRTDGTLMGTDSLQARVD